MSTRAVLARPRGAAGFEGVYLHNAGGPAEMGPVLWVLLRDRYAFDPVRFSREMIDGNLEGWSNIDCLGGPLARTWDGTTKITVEQHQDNFDHDRADPGPTSFQGDPKRAIPGITAPPITESTDNWGADFVYIVAGDGLHVLVVDYDAQAYKHVGSVTFGAEPDWDALEARLE